MDDYVPKCTHDIAETCCDSISIEQLQELSEDKTAKVLQPDLRLDYGEIRGSTELRENLARLYSTKVGSFHSGLQTLVKMLIYSAQEHHSLQKIF
jgi:hypothetical protein